MRRQPAAATRVEAAPLARRSRSLVVRRLRRVVRYVRDALLYVTILASVGLLAFVPLRVAVAAAGAAAGALGPWLGRAWSLADRHLAIAFPALSPGRRAAIVRATFANVGRSFAEVVKFRAIRRDLARYVEAEGLEHMRAALADGRSAIAISGHIGNWELLAAYCSLSGLPVSVIGRRLDSPLLNRLLVAFRARQGVKTIIRDSPGSGRAILSALRSNRILALLIDQDTRGPRVFVPFFGRLAGTPSGAAALALRTGAPVVPAFITRRPGGGHSIRFYPPFPPADPSRDTPESLTAAYTTVIERHIRACPDQWVWWHRRWRRQPANSMSQS